MNILCTLLIIASVLAANAKPNSQVQSALDQYLVHARSLDTFVSEDMTTQCFSIYMPMLNQVAATFSSSYQDCITTANAQTANLTAQAEQQQKTYQSDVSTLCSAFTACNNNTDTANFFNCYANAADNDVSVIYNLASNAASSATSLSSGIQAIQATEYQCTNTTQNNYVRDTAATYDLLDNCLKNGVPTTTATSSSAPETTSTTEGGFFFGL